MSVKRLYRTGFVCFTFSMIALGACSDDSEGMGSAGSAGVSGSSGSGGSSGSSGMQSLCDKYGGANSVASVIKDKVVPEIAGDCRIRMFFTSLPPAGLTHVVECLSIQAQELFGCSGITYAGSKDTAGVPCRSMREAHTGLAISKGDFDALIEDVVAGLTAAGVAQADIQTAAPALLGLESSIVENTAAAPTKGECDGGGAYAN